MAKHPVTKEDVQQYSDDFHGGVKRPRVVTSAADPVKARVAKKAIASQPMFRERSAGMMIDTVSNGIPYSSGSRLDAYRTSYANGLDQWSGATDVPSYFRQMNEQNGGILYWPVTLQERYQWYRYWARTDAYIGRSLELLSDLPMSKLTLSVPKSVPKKRQGEVLDFFKAQLEEIDAFQLLLDILWETNMIGNCFEPHMRVHTNEGMRPICEVRKGDMVLTESGRYRPVSEIMRRKSRERLVTLDIARMKHSEWSCTSEHPVFVHGSEEPVAARDIRQGDYVQIGINKETKDIDSRSIMSDFNDLEILSGRYDFVSIQDDFKGYSVSVEYRTRQGVSSRNEDVRDSLLGWLSSLDGPVVADCKEVADMIGVDSPSRLRTSAYTLEKKGIIKKERTSKGRIGGSSIKWYPFDGETRVEEESYSRTWNKNFSSEIEEVPIDDEFLYLLGYWLGDGWLWKYKRHNSNFYQTFDICFEKNSPCIDAVGDAISSVFGKGYFEFEDGSHCNDELSHFVLHDELFCEWWGHHFGHDCKSKKVPEWIMQLPSEKLIWLLRGMIDSDGCVSGSLASIDNTNESLMQQLFQIGIKCGIPFCFNGGEKNNVLPNGEEVNCKIYRLSISEKKKVDYLIKGCVKESNAENETTNEQPYFNYIEEAGKFFFKVDNVGERFYDGYVYNIEVEEDHTYCVENIQTHNCYIFHEWDEKKEMWSKAVVLPPEEVCVFEFPFSQIARVEYRPERLISMIKSMDGDLPSGSDLGVPDGRDCDRGDLTNDILENIPDDLKKMVREKGCIVMDTDPMTGSFVHHIARRKSPYLDLGASALERVLVPMLQKEHYRYTQLSLASRNMTPKNLISAEGLMPDELDDLRTQVDLSYMDPEYSIITNYPVTWEQIGAQDRLIDLTREYESIDNQIFAALGVTRELLTGDGMFSGNKITIEILNTMFLLSREVLKDYLEKQLFKPICEKKGWYEEDKNGVKKYWYPHVGFNRLTIRDNAEVFDSLFQLYQKGSLPVEVIYELFNLDADRMAEGLKKDLFTVNDATFNRMVEDVNSEVGRALVEKTDIVEKQAKYLGLEFKDSGEDDGFGGGFGGGFGEESSFGGGFQEEGQPAQTEPQDKPGAGIDEAPAEEFDKVVEEVSDELEPGATEEDVKKLIEDKSGAS